MNVRKLELVLRVGNEEVSRPFMLDQNTLVSCDDDLIEALAISIARGFSDKPDLIKGMLVVLIDKLNK